jgi:hypothetical protein
MSSSDQQITPHDGDVEKGHHTASTLSNPVSENPLAPNAPSHDATKQLEDDPTSSNNKFLLWTKRIERIMGFEARGIHRVKDHEKTAKTTLSPLQIVLLWFSINTAAQNITLASIGQSVYGLGFVDAILCSIFGAILGSIPAAYTATWGPISGNRTLVCSFQLVSASFLSLCFHLIRDFILHFITRL